MNRMWCGAALAVCLCSVTWGQSQVGSRPTATTRQVTMPAVTSPALLLEKGIYTEETVGDLDAAIGIYRDLVSQNKSARRVAAQAQYRLAMCLVKKGDKPAAAGELRTLLANYPQETELTAQAKARLAELMPPSTDSAPRVLKTTPAALANDVDPALDKITVTFDRPMMDKSWSFTGGDALPERAGEISYDAAHTTCTMPVKLHPGKVYWVGVNSPSFQNFKSASGVSAQRYAILFATKSADGKPTPLPEEMVKQTRTINAPPPTTAEQEAQQANLKNWVEDFFSRNYRDITARKTLEWGEPEATAGGNLSIRYKYLATIWNKDQMIIEQRFTFTPEGKYVSAETVEKGPASQSAAQGPREVAEAFLKALAAGEYRQGMRLSDPASAIPQQLRSDLPEMEAGLRAAGVALKDLKLDRVHANQQSALAATKPFEMEQKGKKESAILQLTLMKNAETRGLWVVGDIDLESPDSAKAELVKFLAEHPQAAAVPASQPTSQPTTQPAAEAVKTAVPVAEAWLKFLDAGQYGQSWDAAAEAFRKQVPKSTWQQQLQAARGPLGKVQSRKLSSAVFTTTVPGGPDGEYVVIQFATDFETKKQAVETLTPMKCPDGVWRVSGYFIK